MSHAPTARRSRREILVAAAGSFLAAAAAGAEPDASFERIERDLGGRIGLSFIDTGTGRRLAYRGDERFAMCSTFKAGLVAAVLAQVDRGAISLAARVTVDSRAILPNSPITGARPQPHELTIGDLCAAAVEHSDNSAANLLMERLGGPAAVTRFFRSLGDDVTRVDRMEMALNSNLPGDPRDTTTPAAMASSLRSMVLGPAALDPSARKRLLAWMENEQRGRRRIRAGVPAGWRVANKPGTGANGAVNDIAVLWPPGRAPLVLCVYTNSPARPTADSEAAIAGAARHICRAD